MNNSFNWDFTLNFLSWYWNCCFLNFIHNIFTISWVLKYYQCLKCLNCDIVHIHSYCDITVHTLQNSKHNCFISMSKFCFWFFLFTFLVLIGMMVCQWMTNVKCKKKRQINLPHPRPFQCLGGLVQGFYNLLQK